eukprot:jgi/Tetstr1/454956/TSEL_041817.t1
MAVHLSAIAAIRTRPLASRGDVFRWAERSRRKGAAAAAAAGDDVGRADAGEQDMYEGKPGKGPSGGADSDAFPCRVPWTMRTMFEVMIIWVLAFWFLGNWVVPLGLELQGIGMEELSARGQAAMHLVVDVSELVLTLGILWLKLRRFKPRSLGLFPTKLRGNWMFVVALACLSFPLVDWLALQSQNLLPNERDEWAASLEHSLSGGDWITNGLYLIVVSICAPIWEEVIFRGFLLPSISRYLPIQGAVFASSVCFAMAHFSIQRFLPLVFLGFVMGTVYVRTRNLLSSIALHSLWNLYIFYQLAARGLL